MRKYLNLMPNTMTSKTLFESVCPPLAASMTSFCDLALGTSPWVAQGTISMVFWLNSDAMLVAFETYINQFMTKCQSIQDRIHPV